jgi:uncharacterized protein (DUF924 family)
VAGQPRPAAPARPVPAQYLSRLGPRLCHRPPRRSIALLAIEQGHDKAAPEALTAFFYLPFEHSERLEDQDHSIALFDALGERGADLLRWAKVHRDIIVRFGRFPHRNATLGRETTGQEQAFLDAGGFKG